MAASTLSLAERLPGHDLRSFDLARLQRHGVSGAARGAQVIGVRRIHGFEFDRAVVERLPDLQFLHKSGYRYGLAGPARP